MTLAPPLPPGSARPVLELEGLVKHFNGQTVLEGIDLTVAAGETVCVLGPSQSLARRGMTMLIVTHEMNFARRSADRIVFMDEGKIIETGEPEAFFAAPRSTRARSFLANHNRQVPPHHDQPETVLIS